jgi:hypothetical protein
MQNNMVSLAVGVMSLSLCIVGCVNPPNKNTGALPKPTPTAAAGNTGGGNEDGGGNGGGGAGPASGDGSGTTGGTGQGDPSPLLSGAQGGKVTVKYWLNKTVNNNCLTIQAGEVSPISAKCSNDAAQTTAWIIQDVEVADFKKFKAKVTVDSTEKATAKTLTSSTEKPGDEAWRWRCVKTQDKVTSKTTLTVCYEDGNASSKVFESSDLFVQLVGADTSHLDGIQCQTGASIDMVKCSPK